MRDQIQAQEDELKKLRPLQSDFDRLLDETKRTMQGEFVLMMDDCAGTVKQAKAAEQQRYSKEKALKASEAAVHDLTEKVAALTAELLILRADEEARLRQEAIGARQRERAQRHDEELASALHKREIRIRSDLHRRAEAAELAAGEAHGRLEQAQARRRRTQHTLERRRSPKRRQLSGPAARRTKLSTWLGSLLAK